MTVFEFENVLKEACVLFRNATNNDCRNAVAKSALALCSNNFEEQCVVERLKELRP